MRTTAKLAVKGTRYYKANELLQRGSLTSGLAIRLEHEPDNHHDKNAVSVRVKRTGAMLGHLSKEVAPKYVALINRGKIIEASIINIEQNGAHINIDVRIVYEQSEEQLAEKYNFRFGLSASAMPTEPGIYAIRNIDSGRQYIGSSNNLKDRIRSHIRDLSLGCHANHPLQSDFSHLGADHFEAKVLISGVSPSNLSMVEADRITSLLNLGAALYNLTADGQGTGRNSRGYTDSEPVSDRLAKQCTEAEQRQIDEIFFRKRKEITDSFDLKLAALLPKTSFWMYFVATFVGALILLAVLIPKIKDGSLFTLSAILAFIVSPFISGHFQEKAKQSAQYQSLVKQRDEQLAAIDNERKKMQDYSKRDAELFHNANDMERQVKTPNKETNEELEKSPPQTISLKGKKWHYDNQTRVLRNNSTGKEYSPKEYEYQRSSNTSGYQILHGPDVWVNDWDIDFI